MTTCKKFISKAPKVCVSVYPAKSVLVDTLLLSGGIDVGRKTVMGFCAAKSSLLKPTAPPWKHLKGALGAMVIYIQGVWTYVKDAYMSPIVMLRVPKNRYCHFMGIIVSSAQIFVYIVTTFSCCRLVGPVFSQ